MPMESCATDNNQHSVKESLKQILTTKAMRYNAIVIGEDQNNSLYGVISAVQEAAQGKIPLYIGKSIHQLRVIRHQLINEGLRAFYLLDNKTNQTPLSHKVKT